MTAASPSYLDVLKGAADAAAAVEEAFRREVAGKAKALEQERAFAFRRLNVTREIAEAVAPAKNEEIGIAAALAILRAKLGWWEDSETRAAAMSHFVPVARAIFEDLSPSEEERPVPDVLARLREFENWYAANNPAPFWALFEHDFPELPLVER